MKFLFIHLFRSTSLRFLFRVLYSCFSFQFTHPAPWFSLFILICIKDYLKIHRLGKATKKKKKKHSSRTFRLESKGQIKRNGPWRQGFKMRWAKKRKTSFWNIIIIIYKAFLLFCSFSYQAISETMTNFNFLSQNR